MQVVKRRILLLSVLALCVVGCLRPAGAAPSEPPPGYPPEALPEGSEAPPAHEGPGGEIRVLFRGEPIAFDVPPMIESGRTLVPVRAVMETLGAKVDWHEPTQTVTATRRDRMIKLTIGSSEAFVNDEPVTLDVPAKIVQGRTLVPLRFVAESLGLIVEWDEGKREVSIFDKERGTAPLPPATAITIALPFSTTDTPFSMMPMGETINHPDPPNPGGHPGIDFQWSKNVSILACVAGTVDEVTKEENHGKWDVIVKTGEFYIGYCTMEKVDEKITVGAEVVAGQKLGEPGNFGTHYMIHWELGTLVPRRRICPMAYFDEASRQRICKIWADTQWPEMKAQFPNICNGYYRCEFCRANGY